MGEPLLRCRGLPVSAHAWGKGNTRRLSVRDFPPSVLALVDERQGGRFCVFCREAGLEAPVDVPLELDHRRPLSKGGDNHHFNLQWACRDHNRGKSNRRRPHAIPLWARGPQ